MCDGIFFYGFILCLDDKANNVWKAMQFAISRIPSRTNLSIRLKEEIEKEDMKLSLINRLQEKRTIDNSGAMCLSILFKYDDDTKCVGFNTSLKGDLFLYLEARRSGLFLPDLFFKNNVRMLSLYIEDNDAEQSFVISVPFLTENFEMMNYESDYFHESYIYFFHANDHPETCSFLSLLPIFNVMFSVLATIVWKLCVYFSPNIYI